MIIDSIGYGATAPSTGAAAAAFAGDSLTIRNARAGSAIRLLDVIACNQAAGFHQIVGPSFNDTTRGVRLRVPAAMARCYLGGPAIERLQPQDTLSVTIAGSAVGGDVEQGVLLIYYEDVPGLVGRFLRPEELMSAAVRLVTVYCTLAATAGPAWTGSEAITAESDLLRANTNYAVLGLVNSVLCGAIGIRAPDWSNVRLAVPGAELAPEETRCFFVDLARRTGLATIPVFNSGNKNSVFLDASQDENGADPIISLLLAELSS
jgi:hypothetical protein